MNELLFTKRKDTLGCGVSLAFLTVGYTHLRHPYCLEAVFNPAFDKLVPAKFKRRSRSVQKSEYI